MRPVQKRGLASKILLLSLISQVHAEMPGWVLVEPNKPSEVETDWHEVRSFDSAQACYSYRDEMLAAIRDGRVKILVPEKNPSGGHYSEEETLKRGLLSLLYSQCVPYEVWWRIRLQERKGPPASWR